LSKRIYNVVRPREGAGGKTFWERHGVLIVDGDKISMKLESIPAGEWNGWFNIFEKEDQNQQQQRNHQHQHQGQHQGQGYGAGRGAGGYQQQPSHGFEEDVPY